MRTVCSSTHFSLPPCPSTNLACKIWKCTGGPPKAVNPRSHVRIKTSTSELRRGFVFPPSSCLDPRWLLHFCLSRSRDEAYREMGVVSSILFSQTTNNQSNDDTAQLVANKGNQGMSLKNAGWGILIRIVLGQDLVYGRPIGSTVFLPHRVQYFFSFSKVDGDTCVALGNFHGQCFIEKEEISWSLQMLIHP